MPKPLKPTAAVLCHAGRPETTRDVVASRQTQLLVASRQAAPMLWVVRLLLVLAAVTSCGPPGVVIELYNHTPQELVVDQVYNDASTTSERVAPGSGGEFGPALSWHVSLSGAELELRHPGDEFAEARPFGQQLFRFQAEAPGCIFILRPGQRPPAAELPPQPRGYPLGAPRTCSGSLE